jgi:uncharacterized membrane protein YdbT with pleckstrin-like domain
VRWLVRFLTDPRIGDRLLRDRDEVTVDEVGLHAVCYIIPVLLVLGGLVCWSVVPFAHPEWGWVPILVGFVLVVWGVVRGLKRHIDRFVITNQRVFRVHGLLNRKEATMPLTRILDISVDKPLHGRILNFGHFTFESAAQDQGLREIRYVHRIDDRNKRIQETITDVGLRGRKVGT